jgi:hypothetical protein
MMSQSRQAPLSLPWRRYTPTSRKPRARWRARLDSFSGKMRLTSLRKPSSSAKDCAFETLQVAALRRLQPPSRDSAASTKTSARSAEDQLEWRPLVVVG